MANWVKGKLKIRGKPEDIKRWVEECLHCYFTKWFRDGSYEYELVDDAELPAYVGDGSSIPIINGIN